MICAKYDVHRGMFKPVLAVESVSVDPENRSGIFATGDEIVALAGVRIAMKHGSKEARKQESKQARKQASKQAGRQASKY